MAATVSSPWGKPGAWALDAEEHEDELRQQQEEEEQLNFKQKNTSKASSESDFPSLSAAAATKQPKKKKNQTLSLAEFATHGAAPQPKGLTHEDLLNLPTGPRHRSPEELDKSRLGGAFKSYGLNNNNSNNYSRNGDESGNSRWGNSRVSNREREIAPSRADENDDWSKTKKSPSFGSERRERVGSFFDSHSKADESDSWVSNKPIETRRFGGGASNGGFERRGSFDSLSRDRYGSSNGFGAGASDSDNWGRKKEDTNGNAGSGAGARPKLLLQPRTLPVNTENGVPVKPKGSSPFGDARPREEVLAEKGKDWKEIDEKLESVKISATKDVERGDKGNAASFGRWSFGNGRGGSGNEPRSWRKPDAADSDSRPESAEGTENGHASEDGHNTEDEPAEGN